jgi:ketosteroid isomerase-like protein
MKHILLFGILFSFLQVRAQITSDSNLQSLINAELSFSRLAKEKNTREAFLTFLSDSAITFGAVPRIGKKFWHDQTPNESWLYWCPVYSDIAASGDFGFNTGPWEFHQTRTDEKAIAFGQFVTVWQRQADGEWRALIDIGISHGEPSDELTWQTCTTKSRANGEKEEDAKQRVFEIENRFIEALAGQKHKAYYAVLSVDTRIYRPEQMPLTSKTLVTKFLSENEPAKNYHMLGGTVASSGDLAYVYGTADVDVIKEGQSSIRQTHYMRIWKKENGKSWKVVLDILS